MEVAILSAMGYLLCPYRAKMSRAQKKGLKRGGGANTVSKSGVRETLVESYRILERKISHALMD